MAQKILDLSVKGLYTSPSTFSGVPDGALLEADNIVIQRPNFAQTRRGQANYGTPTDGKSIESLFSFGNNKIRYLNNGVLQHDADSVGAWTNYSGTYARPDAGEAGNRIRSVESNRNFYFLTDKGTMKLDTLTSTPRLAGAPRGQSGSATPTGATGFQPDTTNVAYRIVWGYRDANKNLILGAPSERIICANNAGHTSNAALAFQIPDEIDGTWFYQIYRSIPSASLLTEPSDDLQLAYEGIPTAPQLAAAEVTYTDTLPTSLLQQFLYTNSNEAGILQSNTRPPFAKDAVLYKNYVFYANTRTVHSLKTNLISSEPPDGLVVGSTLKFTRLSDSANFTLTGQAAESAVAGFFKVFNTGDPGADIRNTALSIAKICNEYPSNTFINAYYISNYGEVPGQLQFEMSTLTVQGFVLNSNLSTAWSPPILSTGTDTASENELAENRIYWSRELQPEAVPIGDWLEVGNKAQPIDRIAALRDGILVFKQDGIWLISGFGGDWTLTGVDNTVRILAPNSLAVLDNQAYFLSDQAVVAASTDGQPQIMSFSIERELLELSSPTTFPNAKDLSFGLSYSADREYILSVPTNGTDESCKLQFVYNTITKTWTNWTRECLCGTVYISDNKLYLGGHATIGVAGYTTQERKSYTKADYADEDWPLTVTAHTAFSITVTDVSKVTIGSTVTQGVNSAEVTGIAGLVVALGIDAGTWVNGAATVFTPIDTNLKTIQLDCGDAGAQKHYTEASFIFSEANFDSMDAFFSSDLAGGEQKQTLHPSQGGGWGLFAWGEAPWGGGEGAGQTRIRTLIPSNSARANWIYVRLHLRQCFTSFGLSGLSLVYNQQSTRQRQSGDA